MLTIPTNSNQFQPIPTNFPTDLTRSYAIGLADNEPMIQNQSDTSKIRRPPIGEMILRASRRIDIPSVDPAHFLQNPVQSLKNPGDITHQIMGQSRRERQKKKKIKKKKKILRGSRDTSRVVMWQSWWISREMYFISDWIHRYRPPVFPPVLVWEKFFFQFFFLIFGRFLDDFKNGFGVIFQRFFGWLLDVFWVIFG